MAVTKLILSPNTCKIRSVLENYFLRALKSKTTASPLITYVLKYQKKIYENCTQSRRSCPNCKLYSLTYCMESKTRQRVVKERFK